MNPASLENLILGRGDRWRGKLPVPTRAPAVVRRLFQEINNKRLALHEVAGRAGVSYATISDWRYTTQPTLETFTAVANSVGLDVCLRPQDEAKREKIGGRLFAAEIIICDVAQAHCVSPAVVRGRDRTARIAKIRDEAIARIHTELGFSSTEIGAVFGGRDHTTILAALRRRGLR